MAGIAFTQIPPNLRLPGAYIEFDASLAGLAQPSFKRLILGQRLVAGVVAAGIPTRITSAAMAAEFFGIGSMLSLMCAASIAIDPWVETWAIALDDNPAGVAAQGDITLSGTATVAATLNFMIAGQRVQIAVASGDTANVIGNTLASAINAMPELAVTASATKGVITLITKHAGESGNDVSVVLNYYGETTPAGISVTITPMAGGAANPDIAVALTAMGSEWYRWIAMPYHDVGNITVLEQELDRRYSATVQQGGRAFTATHASHATALSYGAGRNSPHISMLASQGSPTPSYIIAAIYCAVASTALNIDAARPLQTLTLTGMLAPTLVQRWNDTERNLALFDGISTFVVANDGTCRIEAAITQYQLNAAGVDDVAYLYVNTPETLEVHRYNIRAEIALRYPRHKLAADTQPIAPGQPIARPKDIKATLRAVYQREVDVGLMEGFDAYAASLFVEIDPNNPNRVNVVDNPNLVNQLRVFANLVQFKV